MKLFIVLLVAGLASSEKLNRAYLPPPGAILSGGSTDDLQTPLENEATPILLYGPGDNKDSEIHFRAKTYKTELSNGVTLNLGADIKTETRNDKGFMVTETGNPYAYSETEYPRNDLEITLGPIGSEQGYKIKNTQNATPIFRPENGYHSLQGISEYSRINDHYFGKPGNMLITAPEGIIQNYHPNAFGMYGGNPMIIKAHLPGTMEQFEPVKMSGNFKKNHNYPSNEDYTPEEGLNTQKNDDYVVTSTPYIFTTSPVNTVLLVKPNQRNNAQMNKKRPERPQAESDKNAVILNYENVITPDRYSYSFETSNGIFKDESASTLDGVKAQGAYSYTGDDGKVYSVIYSADENGFQPKGDHLPTPPPIPEAIQRVIDQAQRDKEAGIIHDGSYDDEKYGYRKYEGLVNRYMQNKSKNRVLGHNKRKPEALHKTRVNHNQKVETLSMNNSNGQFGIKRILSTEQHNKQKVDKTKNYQNPEKRVSKPIKTQPVDKTNKLIQETSLYDERDKGAFDKNGELNNMAVGNVFKAQNFKPRSENTEKLYKNSTPQEGYYYVPPKHIFKDKNNYLQEEPILNPKIDSFITTTEVPINQIIYKSTIPAVDLPVKDKSIVTVSIPLMAKKVSMTTAQPYRDTISTISNNHDYTEDIAPQEETVFPENRDDNSISPTKNGILNTRYPSTTPMPSQAKHTTLPLGNFNHYETTHPSMGFYNDYPNFTTNNAENDGYYRTTPEIPVTFEDFPLSTSDGETDLAFNIKVDGFGRHIQDTDINAYLPNVSGSMNTGNVDVNEKPYEISRKSFNIIEEPFKDKATPEDDTSPMYHDDDSVKDKGMHISNLKLTTVIGEDFSGPKQPQRYDPDTGYYY